MASKTPIVRQVAWLSMIPQIILIVAIMVIYTRIFSDLNSALLLSCITYLAISVGLRYSISRNHRKGVKLTKAHDFKNTIHEFEKSYDFFSRHKFIDKYRYITLLSSSRASYAEMALLNIAFCYSQTSNGVKAEEYYKRTLAEYPNSGMAQAALKMIEAAKAAG